MVEVVVVRFDELREVFRVIPFSNAQARLRMRRMHVSSEPCR